MTIENMMGHKAVNTGMSREIARKSVSKPGKCFDNSSSGLRFLNKAAYVIGYVWAQNKKYAITHAWIESENEIIDPTLILLENDITQFRYFAVLQFNHDELNQALLSNNNNPGFHLMEQYAAKMKEAQGLIRDSIGMQIDFIEKQ